MRASTAQARSYAKNKMAKGVAEIDKLIEAACEAGEFKIETIVMDGWGHYDDLWRHYKALGYEVKNSHVQTSPNDGDDYLYISWEGA